VIIVLLAKMSWDVFFAGGEIRGSSDRSLYLTL